MDLQHGHSASGVSTCDLVQLLKVNCQTSDLKIKSLENNFVKLKILAEPILRLKQLWGWEPWDVLSALVHVMVSNSSNLKLVNSED